MSRKTNAIRERKFREKMTTQVRIILHAMIQFVPPRAKTRAEKICKSVVHTFAYSYDLRNKLIDFHFRSRLA